jgi:hypothetical protein
MLQAARPSRSLLTQSRSNTRSENKPEFRRPTREAESWLDIAARLLHPNRVCGFLEAQMRGEHREGLTHEARYDHGSDFHWKIYREASQPALA